MIEHTELVDDAGAPAIDVRRAVAPGQFVSYAGSDIARGEIVLRRGTRIGSREIGMLAACGIAEVDVVRRPTRRSAVDRRRTGARPASRCGPARSTTATAPSSRRLSRKRAASRCHSARFRTTQRHSNAQCASRSKPATWCCCRAAPRRARAIFRIASCRSSASPASSCTASRSSPASRCASRYAAASRSRCCRAFRPLRSSPSMPSSRR